MHIRELGAHRQRWAAEGAPDLAHTIKGLGRPAFELHHHPAIPGDHAAEVLIGLNNSQNVIWTGLHRQQVLALCELLSNGLAAMSEKGL